MSNILKVNSACFALSLFTYRVHTANRCSCPMSQLTAARDALTCSRSKLCTAMNFAETINYYCVAYEYGYCAVSFSLILLIVTQCTDIKYL